MSTDPDAGVTGPIRVRPGRPRPRHPAVALFRVHMFPIGHLPVPASRPARQLPPPADGEGPSRFPPQDHPRAALVTDAAALAGSAEAGQLALPGGLPATSPEVEALTGGGALAAQAEPAGQLERGGTTAWPPPGGPAEGGAAAEEAVVLEPGTVIDRFGGPAGRVFAADGTPFPQRSLPAGYLRAGYHRYVVLAALPVWRAVSAPWHGMPGGGVRYRTTYPARDLIALRYLRDITVVSEPEGADAADER